MSGKNAMQRVLLDQKIVTSSFAAPSEEKQSKPSSNNNSFLAVVD